MDDRDQLADHPEANLGSRSRSRGSANYLALLLKGGSFNLLGQTFNVLGLKNTQHILEALRPQLPANSPFDAPLDRVIQTRSCTQNLNLASPLLSSISHPIDVHKEVVSGSPPSLDAFAISVTATVTLMFVTVLLVAGLLVLEREENAFPRLTRGLVGRTALLVVVASPCRTFAFTNVPQRFTCTGFVFTSQTWR